MIGIDTNVLVRFLVGDDLPQYRTAKALIEAAVKKGESVSICLIVLSETVWVLESGYEYKKSDIITLLQKMLSTKQFDIEAKSLAWNAVDDYRNSNADFSDCLLGLVNRERGSTVTHSFDRGLKALEYFKLL